VALATVERDQAQSFSLLVSFRVMRLLTAQVYHDALPAPVSFQYPTANRGYHARGFGGAGFETLVI